jgi:hypothetical protein
VLGRGDHDLAAEQQRGRVQRCAGRHADPGGQALLAAQVPGDHGDPAEPGRVQLPRGVLQGGDRRGHERGAQREVFHRVAGEHHLREHHQVGACGRGAAGPLQHRGSVPGQVTDGRVRLGKGDPQPGHPFTVCRPAAGPDAARQWARPAHRE